MEQARFSYGRGEGMVTFDPAVTQPEVFIAELARMTGFQATVVATVDEDVAARFEGDEEPTPEVEDDHAAADDHEEGKDHQHQNIRE